MTAAVGLLAVIAATNAALLGLRLYQMTRRQSAKDAPDKRGCAVLSRVISPYRKSARERGGER